MMTRRQGIVIVATAVVAVLVVATIVIVNIVKSSRGSFTRDDRAAMERQLSARLEACRQAQDPEICKRQAVVPQAELLKDAKLCTLLDGDARVGCVEAVAKVTMDRGDCQSLDGEDQVRCEDTVTLLKATGTLDFAVCREMHDEAKRDGCISQVTARIIDDGTCAEHGVDVTLCDERDALNEALTQGQWSACDRLSDEDAVTSCWEEARKTMPDPDDSNASTPPPSSDDSGTSPRAGEESLDSDGDGYSDEVEIRNGFDPYGPGRLQ